MSNSEQPAFSNPGIEGSDRFTFSHGLTKREYFAAMAMEAFILLDQYGYEKAGVENKVALRAIRYADALLTELEKPTL